MYLYLYITESSYTMYVLVVTQVAPNRDFFLSRSHQYMSLGIFNYVITIKEPPVLGELPPTIVVIILSIAVNLRSDGLQCVLWRSHHQPKRLGCKHTHKSKYYSLIHPLQDNWCTHTLCIYIYTCTLMCKILTTLNNTLVFLWPYMTYLFFWFRWGQSSAAHTAHWSPWKRTSWCDHWGAPCNYNLMKHLMRTLP